MLKNIPGPWFLLVLAACASACLPSARCNSDGDCVSGHACVGGTCSSDVPGTGSSGGAASLDSSGSSAGSRGSTSTAATSVAVSGASSSGAAVSGQTSGASSLVSSSSAGLSSAATSLAGSSSSQGGGGCSNPADCVTGHCAEDFGGGLHVCAPLDQCPDGATLYGEGFVQCAGDGTYLRTCTAGAWVTTANPQPNDEYCAAGGRPNGGYSARLRCNSGQDGGFAPGTCVSCAPYLAASTRACATSCAPDLDALCWEGYHCFSGNGQCYANAIDPANRCDVDAECGGGYCGTVCEPLVHNGGNCGRNAECAGGTCLNGTCCSGGNCCNPTAMPPVCGAFACDAATFTCNTTCTANSNANCAAGFHCFSGNSQCFSNADGNLCDSHADCASGYCLMGACAPARPIQRIDVQCCSQGTNCVLAGGGGGPFRFVRVTAGGAVLGDLTPLAMASPGTLYSTAGTLQFTTFMDVTTGTYFATFGGEGSSALTCHFTFRTTNGTVIWVDSFDATSSDQVVRNSTGSGDVYRRFFYDGATVTSSTQSSL